MSEGKESKIEKGKETAESHDSARTALHDVITRGVMFQHFRGGIYVGVCSAIREGDLERQVVYQSLTGGTTWVRSAKEFFGRVEVDGKKVPMFRRIDKREDIK